MGGGAGPRSSTSRASAAPSGYVPRAVDAELSQLLSAAGAVLIEGPRACGKTATARQRAASEVRFDVDPQVAPAMAVEPSLLLAGPAPRLLDEWQLYPEIWNHVRREVDDRGLKGLRGQFILTGSAMPADEATRHSGAGRIARLRMRPMSLAEAGVSTGEVSLAALMAGNPARGAQAPSSLEQLADHVAMGGWPALLGATVDDALRYNRAYIDEISRIDVLRIAGARRDPIRIARLIRSLARNVATYASATTLAADTEGPDDRIEDATLREYLQALARVFVTENQPPWEAHLRSKSILRKAEKRLFVDPSLAVAAMGADPSRLLSDLNLFGLLFENLVIRDLRIHAQAMDAQVYQYHDNLDLEVDAIVEARDGRWAAFEVKLGAGQIDAAAATLLKFKDRVDTVQAGPPAALGVICRSDLAYTRPDGVAVIPIYSLAP